MRRQFFWLLLAALFLNFFDRTIGLGGLKKRVHWLVIPLQKGMVASGVKLSENVGFLLDLPVVYRENRRLRAEIINYQKMELENEELRRENASLRQQLGAAEAPTPKIAPVSVLGILQRDNEDFLVVAADGVRGNVLVLGKMLIGEMVSISGDRALVRTIYSPNSRVAASVFTDEGVVGGLAEGKNACEVFLTKVLADSKIKKGDLVVTSGMGGKFPAGLIIGKIEEVSVDEEGIYQSARLGAGWKMGELTTIFALRGLAD